MIFNSLTFVIFLFIVFSLYWLLDRKKQNLLLVVAGYVFYGWWDWKFLSLLLFSSSVDYVIGLQIGKTEAHGKRKLLLSISVVTQLGLLAFFKYFNFFAESTAALFRTFGFEASYTTLNIVLPVGLSFYTFQTLSYTIDVYRRRCEPHRDLLEFMAFVSFFPQLVAGPIERATNMLNQFAVARVFDVEKAKDGLRQMLWGLFQKVVVADGLSEYVNWAYAPAAGASGAQLLLGTYFFAFQIYCDFCGYTNIAIGCARLFGFELMRNFAFPYFSRNIAEFWQRWHISLSTWFRDYLYIPLGGNRGTLQRTVFNTLVVFTVSGFWHGANWTFVIWGLLNGLYFIPILLQRHFRGEAKADLRAPAGLRDLPSILLTFHLVLVAWVFFRAQSMTQAGHVFSSIAQGIDWGFFLRDALKLKLLIGFLLLVEWLQRDKRHALDLAAFPVPVRWLAYNALLVGILWFGSFKDAPFIYFQF